MTDANFDQTNADPFWSRVRQTLMGSRPQVQSNEWKPAVRQAAIARSLGIKPRLSDELETQLSEAWTISATLKVSLSLLVIQIDRYSEYFAAYGAAATDEMVAQVFETIGEKLPRPADVCYRLGRNQFVVVLPDYPVLMARVAARTVGAAVSAAALPHKESHAGVVTASIGIAVINPRGALDRKFIETAAGALLKAQRRGLNRVEVIDLRKARDEAKAA